MKQVTVVLDVGPQIGFGHLSRSISLIRALNERGASVSVVSPEISGDWGAVLASQTAQIASISAPIAFEPVDPEELRSACLALEGDVIFVDNYRIPSKLLEDLTATCPSVWRIDDQQRGPLSKESIVSPLPCSANWPGGPHLLGPDFAFVDQAYRLRRREMGIRTSLKRLLISFGGSDPANLTQSTVAAALRSGVEAEVDVVIGPGYAHRTELELELNCHAGVVALHDSPSTLVDLIARADLAIGSPGHTSWERCSLGLPALLITQAENQIPVGQFIQAEGAGEVLGAHPSDCTELLIANLQALSSGPATLEEMSARAFQLVDALGPGRVADRLLGFSLRPAEMDDAQLIFTWINDPAVRKQSLQSAPIDWDSHVEWLQAALVDQEKRLIIAELDGQAIGQIRFERANNRVRISFLVSPAFRGRRIAKPMLNVAILQNDLDGEIHADVREENLPSLAVFRGLLFNETNSDADGVVRFTMNQLQS